MLDANRGGLRVAGLGDDLEDRLPILLEPRRPHALDPEQVRGRARPLADQAGERLVRKDRVGGPALVAGELAAEVAEPLPEGVGREASRSSAAAGVPFGLEGLAFAATRTRPPSFTLAARSEGRSSATVVAGSFRKARPDSESSTIGRNESTSCASTRPARVRASSSVATSAWRKAARMPKVESSSSRHRASLSDFDPTSICATTVLPNLPFARATPERALSTTSRPASVSIGRRRSTGRCPRSCRSGRSGSADLSPK